MCPAAIARLLLLLSLTLLPSIVQSRHVIREQRQHLRAGLALFRTRLGGRRENTSAPAISELAVDTLFVADFSLYRHFLELSRGDDYSALIAAQDYLKAIHQQVRRLWLAQPTLFPNDTTRAGKAALHVELAGVFVALYDVDSPLENYFATVRLLDEADTGGLVGGSDNSANSTNPTNSTSAADAMRALDVFVAWLHEHKTLLPPHHFAVLLTKWDLLHSSGDTATQGMAYVGSMCGPQSAAVVEDVGGMSTAVVVAHELAHSLGAHHDRQSTDEPLCDPRLNFLMAPSLSGSQDVRKLANSLVLSQCSRRQIAEHLSNSSRCVTRSARKNDSSSGQEDVLPGAEIPFSRQCQMAFDPRYGTCPMSSTWKRTPDEMCRRIWCKNRLRSPWEPCETKSYLPALDGTRCSDNGRVCIRGQCTAQNQDDDLCRDLNMDACERFDATILRLYCKKPVFQQICCATCQRYTSSGYFP